MKKPYSKFYWADWRNEMTLKLCSLAARGLWVEILSLMGIGEKIGYLQLGGEPISEKQLAVLCGISQAEVKKHLAELEANGVFSRDENGIIYSRRMAREAEKYIEARENGLKGGNPLLVSKKQETRSKKLEATDDLTQGVKGKDKGLFHFDEFWSEYPRKQAKAVARKSWKKMKCDDKFQTIIDALRKQKVCDQWTKDKGKYIPYGSTWINQERWEDEIVQDNSTIKPATKYPVLPNE